MARSSTAQSRSRNSSNDQLGEQHQEFREEASATGEPSPFPRCTLDEKLDELRQRMDDSSARLDKLEADWKRLQPMIDFMLEVQREEEETLRSRPRRDSCQ